MTQQKKQWGAILVMIALFAMIAFVTNLCSPMANIIKAQGEISEVLAQIGNYGNFVAYLIMGIPAGMLIAKFGYKKNCVNWSCYRYHWYHHSMDEWSVRC